jgi:fumarate reductase (CoM/CoB) subunit A
MNMKGPQYIQTDVLIIGSGGAGLRAAIAAREKGVSVIIVSKSPIGLGNNTALAGALIASATGEADHRDNPEVHTRDTLESGRFLNDRTLVERMTERAVSEIANLEKYGVPIDRENGKHLVHRAAGHSYPRTIGGRMRRGSGYTVPLKFHAEKMGVTFRPRVFISKLLVNNCGISGALGFDWNGNILVFLAKSVVLAVGGLGRIYQYNNNAPGITGDGYALAYDIGVPLRDMEFVQFYPTWIPGRGGINYELWVLNLGAKLKNALGEDIFVRNGMMTAMEKTRDRTAQAVFREIAEGRGTENGIIFDLNNVAEADLSKFQHRLATDVREMISTGKKEFVVSPACHFHMGGCVVDVETRTNIRGLFAAGEVTGGKHGANRLASNALAEIFVFGSIAGENAAAHALNNDFGKTESGEVEMEMARLESFEGESNEITIDLTHQLQATMWNNAGIIRREKGLKEALAKIDEIRRQSGQAKAADIPGLMRRLELDNLRLVGEMVSRAALNRTESRGSHFRDDYPAEVEEWRANLFITNKNGQMVIEKKPVAA